MNWQGKKVLVSAGPTREHLDPVRFLSNLSTGKMGVSIADEFAQRGATVTLVLGPTNERPLSDEIEVNHVVSARDMFEACMESSEEMDLIIMSAAVADYRPKERHNEKMKKKGDDLSLDLERTDDILKSLGETKSNDQILVGFALETENELENAKGKLKRKNLDLIVLNSMKDEGAGFSHNTNKVTFIDREGSIETFDLKSKVLVAKDLANYIEQQLLNE